MNAYRQVVENTKTAPGPKQTWVAETIVHGEDIRRPLGLIGSYPMQAITDSLRFYSGSNAIIGGKSRVAGLTLRATDAECVIGSGPEVEGPALSLLLAASGRKSALDELKGPGVTTLRERP